jgi:hypothetical protein
VVNALAEISAWIEPVVGGWRYLFSPAFRTRTHEAWRHEHVGYAIWDVFWGVLGIAASLVVAYLLVVLTWQSLS